MRDGALVGIDEEIWEHNRRFMDATHEAGSVLCRRHRRAGARWGAASKRVDNLGIDWAFQGDKVPRLGQRHRGAMEATTVFRRSLWFGIRCSPRLRTLSAFLVADAAGPGAESWMSHGSFERPSDWSSSRGRERFSVLSWSRGSALIFGSPGPLRFLLDYS